MKSVSKRRSNIHGQGLFADEDIAAFTLIGNTAANAEFIKEENHDPTSLTDIRLVGDIYIRAKISAWDYINHSTAFSNCIFIMGFVFTTKSVKKDDELLCDYQLINCEYSKDILPGLNKKASLKYQMNWLLANINKLSIE